VRFTKNNFLNLEKNRSVITFPVKNLSLKDYHFPADTNGSRYVYTLYSYVYYVSIYVCICIVFPVKNLSLKDHYYPADVKWLDGCIYTCIYAYLHIYICIYMYVYINGSYTCLYIFICVLYIHICMHMYCFFGEEFKFEGSLLSCWCKWLDVCIHTWVYVYYICICKWLNIRVYIYVYMDCVSS
jgi:hypothetical protein